MSRLIIVLAAAGAFLMPDVQSADACGVKMSVKGARVRQARASLEARRARGTSEQRAPKAVGPIQVSARAISAGGGATAATPTKSVQQPKRIEKTPDKVATAPVTPKPKKKKTTVRKPDSTPSTEPATTDSTASTEPATTDSTPSTEPATGGAFHKEYSFENGSARIGDEQREHLVATAGWMKANPKKRLVVSGHANRVGSPETNQAISEARAAAVVDFLVAEGVPAKRITSKGFGSKKPAYKPAADPRNRRVILTTR